jgi:hypothetical protein
MRLVESLFSRAICHLTTNPRIGLVLQLKLLYITPFRYYGLPVGPAILPVGKNNYGISYPPLDAARHHRFSNITGGRAARGRRVQHPLVRLLYETPCGKEGGGASQRAGLQDLYPEVS